MEFLQGIGSFTTGLIVPTLFILTLVVFVHELGHFLVARWCGVTVKVFSIGFGPELAGFTDKKGTRWRISAIPLGGYVRFLGDENAASAAGREAIAKLSDEERKTAFATQSLARRAAVVAAGPFANFALGVAIFAIVAAVAGRAMLPAEIDEVLADSPAAAAGFEPGDRVVAIDGNAIESFEDFQRIVGTSNGRELDVTVVRDGERLVIPVAAERAEIENPIGDPMRTWRIGIQQTVEEGEMQTVRLPVPEAIAQGFEDTGFIISQTLGYFGRLIVGQESLDQLGGPITVARYAQEAADVGFWSLIGLAGLLSVSIGFINLLPIPLLDGGHLLFFGLEAIRRRPVAESTQEVGLRIGLLLILALMVVAFVNDFSRVV